MKKLTVSDFFWFSAQWVDDEIKTKSGWRTTISKHKDLVIHTCPKQSFGGFILDTNTGEKLHLKGGTINKVIAEVNKIKDL